MTALWAALAGWAAGGLAFGRLRLCGAAPPPAGDRATLSVIIPARNEAGNLPPLLASLAGQSPPPTELLVVDDASEDATAAVARAAGARVVAAGPLPPGWLGKPWACRQGAMAARGELLLFLDADTRLEPGGLHRLIAARDAWGGVLSVLPYHRVARLHEQFSALFNLMTAAGCGAFTLGGSRRPPRGLFGPCLLVRREDYEAVGGHDPVRGRVLEHFHLAAPFAAAGVRMQAACGRGTLSIRMYPHGWRELAAGWSKAFAHGAGHSDPLVLAASVLWIGGAILAASGLLLPLPGGRLAWGTVYALYALQVLWLLRRLGSFSPLTALAYPAPLLFFLALFGRSAWLARSGRTTRWKGRAVHASIGAGSASGGAPS